jgi:hypothetical protein
LRFFADPAGTGRRQSGMGKACPRREDGDGDRFCARLSVSQTIDLVELYEFDISNLAATGTQMSNSLH